MGEKDETRKVGAEALKTELAVEGLISSCEDLLTQTSRVNEYLLVDADVVGSVGDTGYSFLLRRDDFGEGGTILRMYEPIKAGARIVQMLEVYKETGTGNVFVSQGSYQAKASGYGFSRVLGAQSSLSASIGSFTEEQRAGLRAMGTCIEVRLESTRQQFAQITEDIDYVEALRRVHDEASPEHGSQRMQSIKTAIRATAYNAGKETRAGYLNVVEADAVARKLEALLEAGVQIDQSGSGCLAISLSVMLPALGVAGSAVAYNELGPLPSILGLCGGIISAFVFDEEAKKAQARMDDVHRDVLALRKSILATEEANSKGADEPARSATGGRVATERLVLDE